MEHPVCIRPIVDLLHLQTRSSQESLSLDTGLSFDLTPWPLAFSVHWPNRLGSFSNISVAAATAETAVTAESFPKILVCLLTVGQSVRMFITKHPSRCFPSFVDVVDVTIAATISDQHLLTIHGFCGPAMVSCMRWISLTCNNIQL